MVLLFPKMAANYQRFSGTSDETHHWVRIYWFNRVSRVQSDQEGEMDSREIRSVDYAADNGNLWMFQCRLATSSDIFQWHFSLSSKPWRQIFMIRLPERSWKSGRISSSSLLFNVILVSSRSLFCLFFFTQGLSGERGAMGGDGAVGISVMAHVIPVFL